MGMGRGRGQGPRPEADVDTRAIDSPVKSKVGKGVGIVVGETGGPNLKGEVGEATSRDFETATRGMTDPLINQSIPKTHQQHTQEYFDRLRDGE